MVRSVTLAAAGLAVLAAGTSAKAQEATLAVVGSWSGLSLHQNFEIPYWTETLPEASDGRIAVELTTFDQMGVAGADVYRLLSQGVFDVGATVVDYAVTDAPELEGLDIPLIAPDVADAEAVSEAYAPLMDEVFREQFDAHLLAIVPYPQQVVFCNTEIGGLADLEGLQIRASGRSTAEFLTAVGAEGITMDFAEVPGALQRGVVDCAVTGSLSGYSSGWHEVATHLLPLPVGGWDHVAFAIRLEAWEGLGEELQTILEDSIRSEFEDRVWSVAVEETREGVACLTGNGECSRGEPGGMTLVEPEEEDMERARTALEEEVLPAWAGRVGPEWAARWNDTVGGIAGVQAPTE